MLRQYHTPEGTEVRQPTDKELEFEWEMNASSPVHKAQMETMAELTGKTKEEAEASYKKNWLKAMKE